jgi:hypothetical protein
MSSGATVPNTGFVLPLTRHERILNDSNEKYEYDACIKMIGDSAE